MQEKAVLHLFIPSLLQKLSPWFQDFSVDIEAPHLSSLLLEFDKSHQDANGLDDSFFNLIDPDIRELPSAFYRSQTHNINSKESLMCADPIHLVVGMNDVTLTTKICDLTDDEAKELILILNQHFKDDGLAFIFGSNECWYVTLEQNEEIKSHHLDSMLMKNVIGKQAESEQRNWQIIQNETQMLLHSSEINQQREMAGLETVNSLWFWGAGKPLTKETNIKCIYIPSNSTADLNYQYYAKAAECDLRKLPENINQIFSENKETGRSIVLLLDQLIFPALEDDIDEFQRLVTQIDDQIIKPSIKAWKDNKIDIEINCCDGTVLKPKRPPFYKFWLKPMHLRELSIETGS